VNRSGFFVGKTALKSESKDVISAPLRHCFAPGTFPDLDSAAAVSAILSGSGFAKDCAGDSARYNGEFFESGNQEPRKMGFQENGISKMESKSLRGNRTRAEPSEFSTDFVLFC